MQSNAIHYRAHLGQTTKEFSNITKYKEPGTLATSSTAYNHKLDTHGN